ncbi:MAG: hypothetical protein WBA93_13530 [Microcoleaceae cyanobacterium]
MSKIYKSDRDASAIFCKDVENHKLAINLTKLCPIGSHQKFCNKQVSFYL